MFAATTRWASKFALLAVAALLAAAPAAVEAQSLIASNTTVALCTTPQAIQIGSSTGAPIRFTVSETFGSGSLSAWFQYSLSQSNTPATLTLALVSSGASPQTGTVTLTDTANSSDSVVVNLSYTPGCGGSSGSGLTSSATSVNLGPVAALGGVAQSQVSISTSSQTGIVASVAPSTANGVNWLSVNIANVSVVAGNPVTVTITATSANLTNGTYQGSVTFTPNGGGSSLAIGVTFTVGPGGGSGTLSASPNSFNLAYPGGSQAVSVTSPSGTASSFTVAAPNTTNNWLLVNGGLSQISQSINSAFTVSLNSTANSVPSGTVATLTLIGSDNSTTSVSVTLTNGGSGSGGLVAPTSLTFAYQTNAGGFVNTAGSILVNSTGSWSAGVSFNSGNQTWLTVSQSGNTGQPISVSVAPQQLAPGAYTATITVTTPGGSAQVPVALNVTSQMVATSQPPAILVPSYSTGDPNPPAASVYVYASDNSAHPVTATASAPWITVNSGSIAAPLTPAVFGVQINAASLANGLNSGSVSFAVAGAADSPWVLPVAIIVNGGTAASGPLNFSPTALTFNLPVAAPARTQYLLIASSAVSTYSVSASSSGWLSVPAGAEAVGQYLAVTVNPGGIPAGTYSGSLNFSANGASQSVPVTLVLGGAATGLAFYPVTPCRVADTRNASGTFGGPALGANSTRSFPVPSDSCGIPSAAQAYSLNITVVPGGPLTYLTVWPTGQSQPLVSTLNSLDGAVIANAAIVTAGSSGGISVFASNPTQVVIDINGYFAPQSTGGQQGLAFYPLPPCRVADTRNAIGSFGGPLIGGGSSRSFPLPFGPCSIPTNTQAFSLNLTAVPPGPLEYLTAWATFQPQPLTSTLNALDGRTIANAAIVAAGAASSGISVFVSDPSNVIIDTNGYFAPPGNPGALYFYPSTPCRVADTRNFASTFGGPQLAGNSTRSFPILSSGCGLPLSAQAYSLNMTVVPPGPLDYLTTWPAGQAQPLVSTLNSLEGKVAANAAIVVAGQAASAPGAINVYVSDPTHLIVDVNGYFAQ